eukprot:TRINITY_DN3950_c0_g1_i10.p1 TRINITY_DN3950_c0_g1~~TRINITY_DN3950_c0_g1_i10.p1  ORF type:complete len:1057 (-),score=213.20 TRINITY_DN3950_c0_g1_i10:5571-8369(-)
MAEAGSAAALSSVLATAAGAGQQQAVASALLAAYAADASTTAEAIAEALSDSNNGIYFAQSLDSAIAQGGYGVASAVSEGITTSISNGCGTQCGTITLPAQAQQTGTNTKPSQAQQIGFAVGGAMDVRNFRRSTEENVVPSALDITYEGLVNEYYFDSNSEVECKELSCPAYSAAVSADPLQNPTQNLDLYLSVGLDSGLPAQDFSRFLLNIVLVLDVSGSMGERFHAETHDDPTKVQDNSMTKLDVAKTVILDLLNQLNANDSLSIIVFSDFHEVLFQLTSMEQLDIKEVSEKINALEADSGTNMEAGYQIATDVLRLCQECIFERKVYNNRIILLTDAQPNLGDTTPVGLAQQIRKNAGHQIFTTFFGIGLDFSTELTEVLTKTFGANYYAVGSPTEFKQRLHDEFDFMVTPLVFDLKLEIDPESFDSGNGWKIIKAYGSPNMDGDVRENGTLIQVDTLFPSPKTSEGIKGGVILLKMAKPDSKIPLKLKVSYKDRNMLQKYESISEVKEFENLPTTEYFGSTGVQKAVLLARYLDLMRGWVLDQYNSNSINVAAPSQSLQSFLDIETQQLQNDVDPVKIQKNYCEYYPADRVIDEGSECSVENFIQPESAILPVFDTTIQENKNRWEKIWLPLAVSESQGEAMKQFLVYMQDTIDEVGDVTLQQEVAVLTKLIQVAFSDDTASDTATVPTEQVSLQDVRSSVSYNVEAVGQALLSLCSAGQVNVVSNTILKGAANGDSLAMSDVLAQAYSIALSDFSIQCLEGAVAIASSSSVGAARSVAIALVQTVDGGSSPTAVAGSFVSAASSLNGQEFVKSYAQAASSGNCEAAAQVLAEASVLEEGSSTAVADAQAETACLKVPLILLRTVECGTFIQPCLGPSASCCMSNITSILPGSTCDAGFRPSTYEGKCDNDGTILVQPIIGFGCSCPY